MEIQYHVKGLLWDVKLPKFRRKTLQMLVGEFARVNDGKDITDEEATKVLKKVIKGIDQTMEFERDPLQLALLRQEKEICEEFLKTQKIADDCLMQEAIEASVPPDTKNKLSCMKPCIHYLEDKGYEVDKKRLATLLKGEK